MEKTYKYRFSRRAIYWTMVYLVVFVLLGWLLYHLYEGGYLSAWFTSFIVALIALMSLSIPRRIVVTDEKVEVRCLLDITEIRRDEIASVRRVDPRRMKWVLSVFGGCGFFGYYGHFLDLRRFERVKLYASEWKNFVEITDIYEDRLYVSCSDAGRLVEATHMPRRQPPGGRRRRGRASAIVSGSGQKVDRRRRGLRISEKMILYLQLSRNGLRKTKITNNALKPEEMKKYRCTAFPEWVYMTRSGRSPTEASPRNAVRRDSKTGVCRLRRVGKDMFEEDLRNNPVPPRRNGKGAPAGAPCRL